MADTEAQAEANAYLALFAIAPQLLFTGLNGSKDPASAQALVQSLWKTVPNTHVNPKLTDIPWLVKAYNGFLLATQKYAPGGMSYVAFVPPVFDDDVATRSVNAKAALTTLRTNPTATTNVIRALYSGDSQSLRDSVRNARWLAGEYGPDPVLAPIIGDVTQTTPLAGSGVYKPGVQVFVGGLWYMTTADGHVGQPMNPQPGGPPSDPLGQLNQALKNPAPSAKSAIPWLLAGGAFAVVGVAAVYALSKMERHETATLGAHASEPISSGRQPVIIEGYGYDMALGPDAASAMSEWDFARSRRG